METLILLIETATERCSCALANEQGIVSYAESNEPNSHSAKLSLLIDGLFTQNGLNKYIKDLGSYFAITNDTYYLAGNLVSYQTYYFRGDNTKIYVLDANDTEINAIIYEKWTSNNKNTLATIKVVKEENEWLIDNISILANE